MSVCSSQYDFFLLLCMIVCFWEMKVGMWSCFGFNNIVSSQLHSIAMAKLIRTHLETHPEDSLHSWECPSKAEWFIHTEVHKRGLPGRATQLGERMQTSYNMLRQKKNSKKSESQTLQEMGFLDHQDEQMRWIPTNVCKKGEHG